MPGTAMPRPAPADSDRLALLEVAEAQETPSRPAGSRSWAKGLVWAAAVAGAALAALLCRRALPAAVSAPRLGHFLGAVLAEHEQLEEEGGPVYALLASGAFCDPAHYMWSGQDERCEDKCSSTPACQYYSTYASGWCQLVMPGGCDSLEVADDLSAHTYGKKAFHQPRIKASFSMHSSGSFCNSGAFLWSGTDPACKDRCAEFPDCAYFTVYGNDWCQIVERGGCEEQQPADDRTAVTYQKVSAPKGPAGTFPDAEVKTKKEADDLEKMTKQVLAQKEAHLKEVARKAAEHNNMVGRDRGHSIAEAKPQEKGEKQEDGEEKATAGNDVERDAETEAEIAHVNCSNPGEDCRESRCCTAQGAQCYEMNETQAFCRATCVAEGTGWTCKKLGVRAPQINVAVWPGEDCSRTLLCANGGTRCYRKDVMSAYCTDQPGPGWSGELIGDHRWEYEVQPAVNDSNIAPVNSLFCFMAVLRGSNEDALEARARELGAGIFSGGCEAQKVYDALPAYFTREGSWQSFVNTDSFVYVWSMVKQDGIYKHHAWTVKVDPDTVFMPYRLHWHLQALRTPKDAPVYIKNCDMLFGLLGAIEIANKKAIGLMLDNLEDCHRSVGSHSGEDGFMKSCLDSVGAGFMKDASILVSPAEASCADWKRVAFHPHKDANSWAGCFFEANGMDR